MNVNPITPMEQLPSTFATDTRKNTEKTSGEGFASILHEAIDKVAETESADQSGMVSLLTDADVDIASGMIESTQAELALNLAIQVRNKIVDAYNEVMRMQV